MNATSAAGCTLAAEGWFGPTVQGCRDKFDFTLSFEQYIFTIFPASALLIVAPFRIFHLRKLPAVVGGEPPPPVETGEVPPHIRETLIYLEYSQFAVSIQAVATASFCSKAAILVLEAIEKRRYILDKGYSRSPEETSGIYSQGPFLWMNSLLGNGFRQLLKPADLFPVEECMSAAVLDDRFRKTWQRSFTICQPLLLSRFLSHLQSTLEPANIGYGLVAAYGIVYFGMATSSAFYYNRASRMATMLRGMLVSAVYRKTIETSVAATDESASVTLMSTDVEAIVRAARFIHDIWADIVQVAIATWLLSRQIGPAAAAPVIVCMISLGLTLYMSPKSQGAMGAWIEKVQRRVGADEIDAAAPFRLISSLSATIAQIPVLLAPVATFTFFAVISLRTGQTFEATKVFSSLSFVILLAAPLFGTLEAIITSFSALACLERIQEYLNEPPRRDGRRINLSPPTSSQPQGHAPSRLSQVSQPILDDVFELTDVSARPASLQQHASDSHDIQLQNASFGWIDDSNFIVNNVSFVAEESQFVLLAGPVASGKSTLLKGLLGEVPFTSGTVTLSRHKVSWCDQTPWLTNATIRKNIIGFSPYIADLYERVVHACDLNKGFAQLPDGDETVVGSKDISLSGGQKQRVALARAVYSKPQIALFDDVFSGLDDRTSNTVCKRLFDSGGGLLRSWGTTIVLATHSPCALPMADVVAMLRQDGSIEEMGTLQEVSARPEFTELFSTSDKHTVDNGMTSNEPTTNDGTKSPPKKLPEDDKPTDKRRQLGDHAAYGFYFSSLGVAFVVTLLVLEVFTAFFQTFSSVWLKWWTDASAAEGNQEIGLYLGVYAALQVAGVISFFAITWFVLLKVIEKSGLEMHRRLLHAVTRAPLSLFTTEDTGSITTKFSQDLGHLDHNLPMGMLVTINSLLVCVAQAVLIASATWYLAISFPILVGVIYCLQKAFLRTSRQLRLLDLEEKAPIYTQFIETLGGLATIRAFSWGGPSTDLNHELVDRSQKPFYLLLMVQQWLVLVLDLIVAALALLVVGLAVRLRETVSIGFTGVSLVQLITFAETAKMLIQWWTSLETSIGAVSRIKQFTEDSQDENLPGENQPIPEHWPAYGSLEIRGISASYGEGGRMHKALDDITVSIKAGEKIGIVGRTGSYSSGKSSLLLAIVRMLNLSAGSIAVDGLDLATLPREELRSRLITITQDQFFLPGTVRQNIDPHESSTVEDIKATFSKVGLWDTIQEKGGLDVAFEEEMLSHGQRQLFFLARAILRKDCGRLVPLDEATSR
ncbi:hypothetical protein PG991_005894 [Apiospora marii]|uniref:ABC transporter n=1 Tax=Apiospora marii TaxID=335849 RepID=A0ABR1SAH7_9PEZI